MWCPNRFELPVYIVYVLYWKSMFSDYPSNNSNSKEFLKLRKATTLRSWIKEITTTQNIIFLRLT